LIEKQKSRKKDEMKLLGSLAIAIVAAQNKKVSKENDKEIWISLS